MAASVRETKPVGGSYPFPTTAPVVNHDKVGVSYAMVA